MRISFTSAQSSLGACSCAAPSPTASRQLAGRVRAGSTAAVAQEKTGILARLQLWAEENGIRAPKLRIFQLPGVLHPRSASPTSLTANAGNGLKAPCL
jgi:hypothetical protein